MSRLLFVSFICDYLNFKTLIYAFLSTRNIHIFTHRPFFSSVLLFARRALFDLVLFFARISNSIWLENLFSWSFHALFHLCLCCSSISHTHAFKLIYVRSQFHAAKSFSQYLIKKFFKAFPAKRKTKKTTSISRNTSKLESKTSIAYSETNQIKSNEGC